MLVSERVIWPTFFTHFFDNVFGPTEIYQNRATVIPHDSLRCRKNLRLRAIDVAADMSTITSAQKFGELVFFPCKLPHILEGFLHTNSRPWTLVSIPMTTDISIRTLYHTKSTQNVKKIPPVPWISGGYVITGSQNSFFNPGDSELPCTWLAETGHNSQWASPSPNCKNNGNGTTKLPPPKKLSIYKNIQIYIYIWMVTHTPRST